MSQKLEFVMLARCEGANVAALCLRFGIGRSCGYKLLGRWRALGAAGLEERSRRPHRSPKRSPPEVEAAVLALRAAHPAWGGRRIAAVLARSGPAPAPSTVTGILRRHGVELGAQGGGAKAFIRFEHAAPNDLWQMDFKGHVALRTGRLHPLTVLDDHSRFALVLAACADERRDTVQTHLIAAFRRYGMPGRMAMDNAAPWGDCGQNPYTGLTVWLIAHDVAVSHSRPRHPQTLGKEERFHRALKAEALAGPPFADLAEAQAGLDRWREIYNCERPHEALAMTTPVTRYRPSPQDDHETVPDFDYAPGDLLRKVQKGGEATLFGRAAHLPKAFAGQRIAFRPTTTDGCYVAWFRHHKIKTIDLNDLIR